MPLSTTSNREDYVATSGQTVFAYTFRVDLLTDFVVFQNGTLLTTTTDYIVTGLKNPAGGNVIFDVAAGAGDPIIILRILPITQLSDYISNEGFPSSRIEADYEKLTMICQQLQEQVDRSLLGPAGNLSGVGTADAVAIWSDTTVLKATTTLLHDGTIFTVGPSIAFGGQTILNGQLFVGGAPSQAGQIQNQFRGTFTSDGGSTFVTGTDFANIIKGAPGDINKQILVSIIGGVQTQGVGDTVAELGNLRVIAANAPTGTDTIDFAYTAKFEGPPGFSAGSVARYTVWVSGGILRMGNTLDDGSIQFGGSLVNEDTDGAINAAANMHFNIDSDDDEVNQIFTWGHNRLIATGGAELMRLTDSGNLMIGTTSFGGTNAVGVLGITADGTVPTTSPAGIIQIFADDTVAGGANSATLALRTEQAVDTDAWTQSHALSMWINGVEYRLGLDAV